MPNRVHEWARRRVKADRAGRADAGKKQKLVEQIRREAKEAGATLANDGKGGLDPELALRVFRRDEWTCQIPNCETPQEDLDLDHIGGHPREIADDPDADAWLKAEAKKGKRDDEEAIHVLCMRHHDLVHERERDLEDGKKPEPIGEAAAG